MSGDNTDEDSLPACIEEWQGLDIEFNKLEEVHRKYLRSLEHLQAEQSLSLKGMNHQIYRLGHICNNLKYEKDCLQKLELEEKVTGRLSAIDTMKETLPRSNGLYLKIILGNVNVSLLNKQEKLKYKDEYERFKLIVTSIIFFLSFINIFIKYRFMNSSLLFLLVWYYCTLTIRESILKVNGSRIKGWWRTHHFIATVLSGVLLIWPDGITFDEFNRQFMIYNCYTKGFHSWMWRGLSFLLPFLYVAYGFQLYNAYVLWNLSFHLYCVEWQVPVLAAIFLMLFIGNSLTTSLVIHQKFKEIYYDNEDSNTDTKTEKVN